MSADPRDPLTLGVVLAVLGMGGTVITLYVLSLLISLLKRLFPVEPPPAEAAPHTATSGLPPPPPNPQAPSPSS